MLRRIRDRTELPLLPQDSLLEAVHIASMKIASFGNGKNNVVRLVRSPLKLTNPRCVLRLCSGFQNAECSID